MNRISHLIILSSVLFLSACTSGSYQIPIIRAAAEGNVLKVQQLIQQGANIQTRDPQGNTALLSAIIDDHPDVVMLLLKNGANPNSSNNDGTTAFIIAAAVGDLDIIKMLYADGANINQANQNGVTPLMATAGAGNDESVALLLSYGADPCVKDKNQNNALQTAILWWGRDTVQDALQGGQIPQVLACSKDSHD